MEVFSGTCGALTAITPCINSTGGNGIETVNLTGLTSGSTYYVRVYHSAAGSGVLAANSFTICATSVNTSTVCNGIGASNLLGVSLPYTSGAQTTCGGGNEITPTSATNICGSDWYYDGEDKIISFTPAVSGNISINLTSSGSWVGMVLYQGCPTSGGTCVASAQSSLGNQSIGCAPVVSGQTYYLVIDSWPSPNCNPFNVTISAPTGGTPPGTVCTNAVPVSMPFIANNESTLCFGNDYTNSTSGVGTTLYMSGEDKVYQLVTTGPDCISISITNSNSSFIGVHVFSGCPGVAGSTLIGRFEGASGGALTGSITLPSAGTYYILVDTYANPSSVNYNIAINSLGAGASNDNICNAQQLTLGTAVGGDNNCTGSAGEPAAPGCWSAGTMNTVWYSVIVPASGKLKVRTTAGSLLNTQIALYTGTCGAPTFVAGSCNDNVASCAGFTSNDSEINLTGLTSGQTYYVRVDGNNSATGTFSILAVDGNNPINPIPGQDCGDPNPVCNTVMAVSNPGYSGYGNICDLPTSYCLSSGERNVVWYRVPISSAGTFTFNIVPNDFNYVSESETDYDFAVWELSDGGTQIATCSQIAAGTAAPISCNFSYLGVTGVGTAAGNPPVSLNTSVCPSCPGGYNPSFYSGAYESEIDVDANDVYLIAVSNFVSSTSGFRIDFGGSAVIDFAASLASAGGVTWSGGDATTPTVWTEVENWGGCASPDCGRDAYVAPFSNQPILTTVSGHTTIGGTTLGGNIHKVKSLTIQAGASLTLQAGSILRICGDFYNYGTINAHPNSTIMFVGAGVNQIISGNFTGTNKLGNLTIEKTSSAFTVTALNDIEIGGNFLTANATSVFNSNNKYITVAGNFTNSNGNATYTNTGTVGTLEFNGNGLQNYNQGTTQLDLNFVQINNTAAAGVGVTLLTDMFIKATTGNLTLNQGTITTSGTSVSTGRKVHVFNTNPASVSAGNLLSYVDGNLRRYVSTSGDYNWPVGKATFPGYQRARTIFSTTSGMIYIDSRFDTWPSTPFTQAGTECAVTWNQPSEDNGYWTMIPDAGTCTYDCTLYPLNATNTSGMSAWTIIKRSHATAIDGTGWILNGTCASSTATQVTRTGMTNFSFLGVDQALTPLPIELLYFDGKNEGLHNLLEWKTASERDNDYFTLEKSADGYNFEFLDQIDGAGNSNVILNYHSYDFNPYLGITYYRLKQTDYNGSFTYSNTIALTNELDKFSISELYPNPSSNTSQFNVYTPMNGSVSIKLFDNSGRLIELIEKELFTGNNELIIDLDNFAKGIYTVEINIDKTMIKSIQKLIKN